MSIAHEVRVHVVDYGRKYLMMRYTDAAGVQHAKSTKKTNRRDAERVAARWEEELRNNQGKPDGRILWREFREIYERERLSGLAEKTRKKNNGVLNTIEAIIGPRRLRDIGSQQISTLQAKLREQGREEATISSVVGAVRAILQWAVDTDRLAEVPKVPAIDRAKPSKLMKGRPLTDGEFKEMLNATAATVGDAHAPSWRFLLRGLWASGLRLAESLEFYWDKQDKLHPDFSQEFPMYRIHADQEKGKQDRLMPMVPEFAEFLQEVPQADRTGLVFKLPKRKRRDDFIRVDWVGKVISKIGKEAGIVVDQRKEKFASAHDLRRSFGERWSWKVMPQMLMQLMRHENIETTMKYYVGRNAQEAARLLWSDRKMHDAGNDSGNT